MIEPYPQRQRATKAPKALKYIDTDHPFYSDKADKEWVRRRKDCEKEEEEMVKENRRRYREQHKKETE